MNPYAASSSLLASQVKKNYLVVNKCDYDMMKWLIWKMWFSLIKNWNMIILLIELLVVIDPVSKKKITCFEFSMIFFKISDVSIEQ